MSIKQMAATIGKLATYRIHELKVDVEVIDIKQAYGNVHVKIIPVMGSGETWVKIESIIWR